MKYYDALRKELAADDVSARVRAAAPGGGPAETERREPGPRHQEPRKPRKPGGSRPPGGSLGFLGSGRDLVPAIGCESGPVEGAAVPRHFVPPTGKDPIDAPWQAELKNWPEDMKEAWDERAALMEYDGGLDREAAEGKAFTAIAGRGAREPTAREGRDVEAFDLWDRFLGYLRWLGFIEVDPAELDAYSVVPLPDEEGIERPWRCGNPFCTHPNRWWKSTHGVVNCSNCVPPASPSLVVETGISVENRGPVTEGENRTEGMAKLLPAFQEYGAMTGDMTPMNNLLQDWAKSRDLNPARYQLQMLPPPAPAPAPGEAPPEEGGEAPPAA